jgi:leucyl aminopeptidase
VLGASFESTRFKSKPKPGSKLSSVEVLAPGVAADAALAKAVSVAKGVALTKYLVEAPPNVCTPSHLAAAAAHIASLSNGSMELKVLEKKECEELGMGCYLGVAECSDEPPKFIHLKYTPKGEVKRKIAVVAKGLTFDAGGYNIKTGPGCMIELMKFDMGGAGATLGAARILAETQPEGVEVNFIIASCENMIDGKGMRPGDVLVSAAGKTVEVNNTDAEGRLTLCDALWYAQEKVGATSIVDIATLTGACIIALGSDIAGLFTPSDDMADKLSTAGKATGEKLWRMPMEEPYFECMKSSVADMKNTGSRSGGSITAALFLKQFIKEGVEWAHLDVAGPVWDEKASLPTGYGASLLAEWATAQGK